MLNTTINTNNQNANLYSKFANNNISSNKAFLSSAYGKNQLYASNHDVTYYNDENAVKKTKKSKKKAIAITAAAAFSAISILGFALSRNKVSLNGLLKSASDGKINDFSKKAACLMINATNLKDDLCDRIINYIDNKTPLKFIKKWGDNFTGFYKKNVFKSTSSQYNKSLENICKNGGQDLIEKNIGSDVIEKTKDGIKINTQKHFKELFEDIDSSINSTLKNNRISKGLTQGKNESKFTNLIENLTSENIANRQIANNESFKKIKLLDIPENSSKELKQAINSYNNLITDALIPKLRDINCGSAPTDVVTMILPMVGLGVAVANTDDKEERKSITLDIGFPLIATVAMPIVGTLVPVLNGFKAIVAGFAVGQLFSGGAKLVDSVINKAKQKKNNQNQVNA